MDRVKDKRRAILDATLRLVSKNGFHGTAMSKLAREAGVSAGIIYHYFEGKDHLIDELPHLGGFQCDLHFPLQRPLLLHLCLHGCNLPWARIISVAEDLTTLHCGAGSCA